MLVNQLSSVDKQLFESIFGNEPVSKGLHFMPDAKCEEFNCLDIFDFKIWDDLKKSEFEQKINKFNELASHFRMELHEFKDETITLGGSVEYTQFLFILKRK
jgi:hypothetical protein